MKSPELDPPRDQPEPGSCPGSDRDQSDLDSIELGSQSDEASVDEKVNLNSDCVKEEREAILTWIQAIGAKDAHGRFVPKPDCMEPLQQIWRKLADASPKDRTRLHLGNYAAMQSSLIPLLVSGCCDDDLFVVILTIMTWMMKPVEFGCWLTYNQMHFLQVYKQALITSNAFVVIMHHIRHLIAKDTSVRTPEERSLLLTAMLFFKRVLAVPDDKPSAKSSNNVYQSLHDRCILTMHKDNVLDCIRYLAETEISRPCYSDQIDPDKNLVLVLLSCVYYIVHKESPEFLLVSDDRTGASVRRLLEVENNRCSALTNRSSRHSRFGGVVKVASVGGGTRFASTLERSKSSYEHPKTLLIQNRRIFLNDDVRHMLLHFTKGLYLPGFNAFSFKLFEEKWLQTSIHDEIVPKEMKAFVPQFYHVMSFFLAFNRVFQYETHSTMPKFSIDCVAVCFEFDYMDDVCKFLIRSAVNIDWVLIESSLRFYKELLRNVCEYFDNGNEDAAAQLILQINYHQDCRFSLPALLKRYNPKNCSRRILELLIETSYFQLKALDRSSNVVCDRKPKRRRKNRLSELDVDDEVDSDSDDDFEFDRDVEVKSWLQKCVQPQIISNIMLLVKDYKINDDSLNKFAVTVLHKITFQQSFTPMLFRVSFLVTFHSILSDKTIRKKPAFRSLRDFSKFAVREFFKLAQTRKSLVIEALFPITRRICEEFTDSLEARQRSVTLNIQENEIPGKGEQAPSPLDSDVDNPEPMQLENQITHNTDENISSKKSGLPTTD